MKIAIIGHRGVGKTQLANRISTYLNLPKYDLDQLVTHNVTDFFHKNGEKAFRIEEEQKLISLCQSNSNFVIAIGAGYTGQLPADLQILWLKRPTDQLGRIFLNRPRLNPESSPIEEFFLRKSVRDKNFHENYDLVYNCPEGFCSENEIERNYFQDQVQLKNAYITISPEIFKKQQRIEHYFNSRLKWKNTRFELRDDLLDHQQIQYLTDKIPPEKLLLSFRKSVNPIFKTLLEKYPHIRWDWAHELGECPFSNSLDIYSIHNLNLQEAIDQTSKVSAAYYKISPMVSHITELEIGYEWLNFSNKSFLPRSSDGRWKWFRLLTLEKQAMNFLADESPSANDQPNILEVLYNQGLNNNKFAALLGSPTTHSLSPSEHFSFFKKHSIKFLNIPTDDIQDLKSLIKIGLSFAAVTSPLKQDLFNSADITDPASKQFKAANTFVLSNQKTHVFNTDIEGLKNIPPCDVIWGGQGLLSAIKSHQPQATAYSPRTGQPKSSETPCNSPSSLIWAVGRNHYDSPNTYWPPHSWRPQLICDLNYGEDSPGLEYALKTGAQYMSGLNFFKTQAKKQQEIWAQYL